MCDFITAIRAYGQAFSLLFSRKFIWFLVPPIVAIILLILGGGYLFSIASDFLIVYLEDFYKKIDVSWLNWSLTFLVAAIKIMFMMLNFFLFQMIGGYCILILMSPIFSLLSERVEAYLTGNTYPFNITRFFKEMGRGILIALRNMLLQSLVSLVLFFCTFIPLIGLLSPVALFLASAYFYGFSFIDYTMERRYYSVRESVRYIHNNLGMVMGIGIVFSLALLLPYKIIVCSFVSMLAVISGAILVYCKPEK